MKGSLEARGVISTRTERGCCTCGFVAGFWGADERSLGVARIAVHGPNRRDAHFEAIVNDELEDQNLPSAKGAHKCRHLCRVIWQETHWGP
jgi:hypothetical protein